jgi:sigma-E factor negative regulatory protein RseB
LLILIVLVGLPPASVGGQRPVGAQLDGLSSPLSDPAADEPAGFEPAAANRSSAEEEAAEAASLIRLRSSISAGQELSFSGTEIVSAWHSDSSISWVLDLVQGPDGRRVATARDGAAGEQELSGPDPDSGDALGGLSERALDALAAGYDLRIDGSDRVAGRQATVVVAARQGRAVARMWLDNRTGLLLRQDVFDSAGRLHRMAAFVELTLTEATPLRTPVSGFGVGTLTVPAVRRSVRETPSPAQPAGELVGPAELSALRTDGWPCPVALPAGYVLLDARRTSADGRSTLHLTYGDGLSAISVFLQRGELDAASLTGLTSRKWGNAEVYVRDGWPEVMIWQGGPTVITAVGDAEPSDLRTVLSALPRQSNHGTLGSLQQRMGSALAWFRS